MVKIEPLVCGKCVFAITLCQEIIFVKSLLKTNRYVVGYASLRILNRENVIGILDR